MIPVTEVRRAIVEAVAYQGADDIGKICTITARSLGQDNEVRNSFIYDCVETLVEIGLLAVGKRSDGEGDFEREINTYTLTNLGLKWLESQKTPT